MPRFSSVLLWGRVGYRDIFHTDYFYGFPSKSHIYVFDHAVWRKCIICARKHTRIWICADRTESCCTVILTLVTVNNVTYTMLPHCFFNIIRISYYLKLCMLVPTLKWGSSISKLQSYHCLIFVLTDLWDSNVLSNLYHFFKEGRGRHIVLYCPIIELKGEDGSHGMH